MEITCIYRNNDYEINNKKFDDYAHFGCWIADNATEIKLVDVIVEEV